MSSKIIPGSPPQGFHGLRIHFGGEHLLQVRAPEDPGPPEQSDCRNRTGINQFNYCDRGSFFYCNFAALKMLKVPQGRRNFCYQ